MKYGEVGSRNAACSSCAYKHYDGKKWIGLLLYSEERTEMDIVFERHAALFSLRSDTSDTLCRYGENIKFSNIYEDQETTKIRRFTKQPSSLYNTILRCPS